MNGDRYVFKSCKWSDRWADEWLHWQLFKNVLVSIQMAKTLLFINQILQVLISKWTRHSLACYGMLLIGPIQNFSEKIGLLEVSMNFTVVQFDKESFWKTICMFVCLFVCLFVFLSIKRKYVFHLINIIIFFLL